jgi:DNA repair protein RecO (recombination protein O)
MFSTRGIVLDHVKYSETSIIVHIYTSEFGRQSYMINGVRRSKSRGKTVFLQPLTLLQLEVTHNDKKEIHRVVDYRVLHPFFTIPFDQVKRSIVFFITEVLSKVLREEQPNKELFEFVFHAVKLLDEDIAGLSNFHLFFLFQLSRFLGFGVPATPPKGIKYFDLKNSEYKNAAPSHSYFVNGDTLHSLMKLSDIDVSELGELDLNSVKRKELLDTLVLYYELHILDFKSLKSLKVLHSLFEVSQN